MFIVPTIIMANKDFHYYYYYYFILFYFLMPLGVKAQGLKIKFKTRTKAGKARGPAGRLKNQRFLESELG